MRSSTFGCERSYAARTLPSISFAIASRSAPVIVAPRPQAPIPRETPRSSAPPARIRARQLLLIDAPVNVGRPLRRIIPAAPGSVAADNRVPDARRSCLLRWTLTPGSGGLSAKLKGYRVARPVLYGMRGRPSVAQLTWRADDSAPVLEDLCVRP